MLKKRFLLRIDDGLYRVLEKWAADDLRSINAQIEFLLSGSAKAAGRLAQPPGRPEASPRPESDNPS
jgi:hypothetical protein